MRPTAWALSLSPLQRTWKCQKKENCYGCIIDGMRRAYQLILLKYFKVMETWLFAHILYALPVLDCRYYTGSDVWFSSRPALFCYSCSRERGPTWFFSFPLFRKKKKKIGVAAWLRDKVPLCEGRGVFFSFLSAQPLTHKRWVIACTRPFQDRSAR